MAEELFIPVLGQTVEKVTLVEWKVQDGVKVEFGQEILEVETDKAIFPVEANAAGYIHIGPYKNGEVVPVLTVVALIGKREDVFSVIGAISPEVESPTLAGDVAAGGKVPALTAAAAPVATFEKKFASPRARRLAKENDVDLALVQASGDGGLRIIEKDVSAYLSQTPRVTPVARRVAETEGVNLGQVSPSGRGGALITKADVLGSLRSPAAQLSGVEVLNEVPLKGVRAIIAERMAASVHTSARVTLFMDVDATEFVKWRERLKARFEKAWGFAPGYNDLLAKIAAAALAEFPAMNARLVGAPGSPDSKIEQLAHINIGIAVDTERGLMVPVVRDTAFKSLQQFGSELRQMVERARAGRSLPDDLAGGSFTITNLGMFDVEGFTPVINLPECAILGVGRIIPKPVYIGDDLVRREMMTLSLVFDHRIVDGAPAARFMQLIKQMVEDPSLLGAY